MGMPRRKKMNKRAMITVFYDGGVYEIYEGERWIHAVDTLEEVLAYAREKGHRFGDLTAAALTRWIKEGRP